MEKDKTIPDIFTEIFADFNGICNEGLAFVKRQHEFQNQLK